MEEQALVVFVTCPDKDSAEGLAGALVKDGYVACANLLGEVVSLFNWEGETQRESEAMIVMKTRADLFDEVRERIEDLHSYDVPEIIAMPVTHGNEEYLEWIRETTK